MSLIPHFATGTYQVTRKGQGTYQDGFYIAGADETISMRGSLQPTTARELKIQEEGNRLRQYFNFFTDSPLVVTDTKTLSDSDRVTIDCDTFKVMSTEPWRGVDLPYYLSVLCREPENE